MAKARKAAAKKADPFKTKKTRETKGAIDDTVSPPHEIAEAIDRFREAQEQAKHFEAEATIHKDTILDFAHGEFTERVYRGLPKSFKVLGDETMVTYVVMDSSAGLTDEDLEAFAEKWGQKAADELIVRDYGSIRFDAKVLEANYDAVVEALQTLPEEVVEKLFKPMLMRARPGAVESAKKIAKTPDQLRDLLRDLKMKNYLR